MGTRCVNHSLEPRSGPPDTAASLMCGPAAPRQEPALSSQSQEPNLPITPYRRQRRIEVEPVVSAIALIAMVLLIGSWKPTPDAQQTAPVEQLSVKTASATR